MSFTDMLTCICCNLRINFTVLLALVWFTVIVSCLLCIYGSLFTNITKMAGPLQFLCLGDENIELGLCLYHNSEKKLAEE
jgi:hypothetical protein